MTSKLKPFVTRHVAEIEPQTTEQQWLVENLWLASGVGILGGAPKVCKTFLAAEISLAIASGGHVLDHPAHLCGPVLFYGAEDSLSALRTRFNGLANIRQLNLDQLPIYLIDVPSIRLDCNNDLLRLRAAIEKHHPRLLVLDPFVRIAKIDENSAADVSAVLASLRTIQRDFDVAVLLVHHARKSPAAHPYQALRGSSDFAAWSDSNLYLSRRNQNLILSVEHRSAPSPEPFHLRLVSQPAPHLVLLQNSSPENSQDNPLKTQILSILLEAARPLNTIELRQIVQKRKEYVVQALHDLRAHGQIERTLHGWQLSEQK